MGRANKFRKLCVGNVGLLHPKAIQVDAMDRAGVFGGLHANLVVIHVRRILRAHGKLTPRDPWSCPPEVFQTVASYWVCFAVNSGRVESVTLAASEAAITEEPTEGDETPAEEAVSVEENFEMVMTVMARMRKATKVHSNTLCELV
jgi:hypothetical protein